MKRAERVAVVSAVVGLATTLHAAVAQAGTDIWGNVGPASPLRSGGLFGRYPLSHYALDQHFSAVSASITGGVDVSGLLPMIAYFFASLAWLATSFLAKVLIEFFAFAFNLDLVGGSSATGGVGAVGPVAAAIHSIYANVLGGPWLVLAVSVVGLWAMWRALVQRRYSETAGALALSLIYVVVALLFVAEPGQTIDQASRWTNAMSQAFLSVSAHGDPAGGAQATEDDSDQLWDLLVYKPWSVLEFGGLEHCAVAGTGDKDSDPQSAPVRPLSHDPAEAAALARRLSSGTEVSADGKVCVNNANKYGSHFLRFGPGTDERGDEYDALNHGDAGKLPEAADEAAGYRLGVADKPATDAMEEGGQYQRLLIAVVVMVGETGALLLLGSLAIGIILAQVLLLLLLAFSPVALIAAAIPGRGHDFFKAWLAKLAGYLLKKAAYSLILAVLLAVNGALASATSELGWLFSFGLQALFFWAVFLQRHKLTEGMVGIVTGPSAPGREKALGALALYYGARTSLRPLRGGRHRGGREGATSRRASTEKPTATPTVAPSPVPKAGLAAAVPDPALADSSSTPGKPEARGGRPAAAGPATPEKRVAVGSSPTTPEVVDRGEAEKPKATTAGIEAGEADPFKRESERRGRERDTAEAARPARRLDHRDDPRGERRRDQGRAAAAGKPSAAGEQTEKESGGPDHVGDRAPRRDGPVTASGSRPAPEAGNDLTDELRADRDRAGGDAPARPRPRAGDEPSATKETDEDDRATGSEVPVSPPRRGRPERRGPRT